eukprot:TRINITY_DN2848_c0_g1_i1.p1 TRINITY_DN2848_c0_g1~~TRINITY_DN2848_c0_g1_i1.p1  ORF type:complete len:214 (+),score=42.22 TRINITY_DN2848_c0_g1_i1:45-644(+)
MLLSLSEKHKKDLNFLKRIDGETLEQFCQISVQFVTEGFDRTVFMAAANKFGLSPEPLKRALEALAQLLCSAAKASLSELDLQDSLIVLAFKPQVGEIITQFYISNKKQIRNVLSSLSFDLPHYENLEWRLDVVLASRALRSQTKPLFLLKLDTRNVDEKTAHYLEVEPTDLLHITSELESALNELKAAYVRRVVRNVK